MRSSHRWMHWLAIGAALSLMLTVQNLRDPDVWWHLAIGHQIIAHGIPSVEPFSFVTAAHPWIGQQWLYDVVVARMYDVTPGLASLVMGGAATAALVLAALCVPPARRTAGPPVTAALLLSALVAGEVLGVRGQVVSVLGVAAVMYVLSRWREGRTRAVWWLPAIMLLWANLHAGFFAGILLSLVVVAGYRPRPDAPEVNRRALLTATGLAALATLLTPAGPALFGYVADTFANPTLTQSIVEWMSPNFHDLYPRLFLVEAMLLVAAWLAADRPETIDMLLAGGAFVATLQAQRNVALFAVIALPQLIRYGGEGWQRHRPPSPADAPHPRSLPTLVAATIAVILGSAIAVAPGLSPTAAARFEAATFPKAAVGYVGARYPGDRIYTTYELGGYLAHRLPSGRVVFVYGESATFGNAVLQRYLDIHLLRPGWPGDVAREGVRHAILPAETQEVAALRELGWTRDCRDQTSNTVVMSPSRAGQGPPIPSTPC